MREAHMVKMLRMHHTHLNSRAGLVVGQTQTPGPANPPTCAPANKHAQQQAYDESDTFDTWWLFVICMSPFLTQSGL